MITRLWKQVVVATMIVMQMADDDVLDALRRDAERGKPVAHRLDHLALPLLAHRLVEPGIEHDGAGRPDDGPDKEIERLQYVVRIAVDEVRRRTARMMAVTDGVNFVNILGHVSPYGAKIRRGCAAMKWAGYRLAATRGAKGSTASVNVTPAYDRRRHVPFIYRSSVPVAAPFRPRLAPTLHQPIWSQRFAVRIKNIWR